MKTSDSDGSGSPDARFIPPSYELKAKAPLTDQDLDSVVARAQGSLGRHRAEFLETMKRGLDELRTALEEIVRTGGAEDAVLKLNGTAHDLRGLAATFGYATVTDVCDNLCRFLETRARLSESGIEVVRLHVNAASLAANRGLDADTAEARLMLDGLRKVVARNSA